MYVDDKIWVIKKKRSRHLILMTFFAPIDKWTSLELILELNINNLLLYPYLTIGD